MKLPQNPVRNRTIKALREALKINKVGIWLDTLDYLRKNRSKRPSVNIGKISKITKKGDKVLIPGKVLGAGQLKHGLIIGAFHVSKTAKSKIIQSGGEYVSIIDFVKRYPEGKKVRLIG